MLYFRVPDQQLLRIYAKLWKLVREEQPALFTHLENMPMQLCFRDDLKFISSKDVETWQSLMLRYYVPK